MGFEKGHKGFRTEESYSLQAKKYPIWNKGISLMTKKCKYCNENFTAPKWQINRQKYCSCECSDKAKINEKRSEEICRSISNGLKGRKLSKQCKEKKSKYMINLYLNNPQRREKFINAGKKHTPQHKTKQGFLVRSLAEREIANWFFEHHIKIQYEPHLIFFKDCFFIPDFYIPKLKMYIEYYGNFRNLSTKRNNKKRFLYKKINLNIVEIENIPYKKLKEELNFIWQKYHL